MTPWTVVHQTPLCMGFPKQEYWSDLPSPSPRDLVDSGIQPGLLPCRWSPVLQMGCLPTEPLGKPTFYFIFHFSFLLLSGFQLRFIPSCYFCFSNYAFYCAQFHSMCFYFHTHTHTHTHTHIYIVYKFLSISAYFCNF